jgi:hypothetical protein
MIHNTGLYNKETLNEKYEAINMKNWWKLIFMVSFFFSFPNIKFYFYIFIQVEEF